MRALTICSILPLLSALLLSACSAMSPLGNPEAPYPPPREPVVGDLLHVPTGTFLTREQFLQLTDDTRIVYLGETHDNPASHRLQTEVITHLAQRHPGDLAIGMEMFTPAQQPSLDAWVAGELSEKEFLKQSGWQKIWRMDFAYYRPILELARDQKIPVIGLNADKELVRAIGRNRPETLPPAQQQQLPQMDLEDPYQSALVEAIYGGHSAGNAMLAGFQRVQTLWDETMAENIATYLQSPEGRGKRMVVIAGGNHVRNGFGIPRRVFRRLPSSYLLVGDHAIVIPDRLQDRLMNVTIPTFPMPAFDVIAYTEYEELPHKVKLGVLLQEDKGRVSVGKIVPGSNAARAGLQEGDVVLSADKQAVTESFDLVYIIQQKQAGDHLDLRLRRGETELQINVELLEGKENHHGRP